MRKLISFHGFIGQGRIVRFLRRQLQGAQALSRPCPHLLLVGMSGMGKTRLAHSLAKEYGSTCQVVLGKATPTQLCEVLIKLRMGDFLFLDEAHNLPRDSQELLFQVIDDNGRITDRLEEQHPVPPEKRADGKLLVEPVTIILATDQPGTLINALHKRMEHRIRLSDYSEPELIEIAANSATEIGLLLTAQAMRIVAKASQGQPRRAKQILGGIYLHFHRQGQSQLGIDEVRGYLSEAGMDEAGLDREQLDYLRQLARRGRASLETLANLLGVDPPYARSQIEPGLVKIGYLRIDKAGRCLAKAGKQWVQARKQKRRERHAGR
jgi:Holliday junction resolvasome RuvABC ATP-dependent DNA helicase subunit